MSRERPFHPMDMDRNAGRLMALSALGVALCAAAPARADLRMCNNTSNRVSVAMSGNPVARRLGSERTDARGEIGPRGGSECAQRDGDAKA
jgi:hypothetical protein